MTTSNDPKEGSTPDDLTSSDGKESQDILQSESGELALYNQQLAKQLTEKAAAITDRKEREKLLRQALDCEVQARTQGRKTQLLRSDALQGASGEAGPDGALSVGSAGLAGELLGPNSSLDLKGANAELGGGSSAFGGSWYGLANPQKAKDGRSQETDDSSTVLRVEAALPAIDEVLGRKTLATDDSESMPTVDVDSGATGEFPIETLDEAATPSNDTESVTVTEDSVEHERNYGLQKPARENLAILETTEVTVSKTEIIEMGRPRRKPRKLEIKSKKRKPRKIEIRSERRIPQGAKMT